jgi:Zn-dependent peptidase ImmA (M78 family)
MTYIPEARIEAHAAELWRTHSLQPGFDAEMLLDQLGLSLLWEELPESRGTKVLGAINLNQAQVILNERHLVDLEANLGLRRFTIGHEIGHWSLHAMAIRSGTLSLMTGERLWCRNGSRQPAEQQADLFASHLLMPTHRLRHDLPKRPWSGWRPIYALAETFSVSATAMIVRLERAGWAHRDEAGEPASGPKAIPGQLRLGEL